MPPDVFAQPAEVWPAVSLLRRAVAWVEEAGVLFVAHSRLLPEVASCPLSCPRGATPGPEDDHL